jgi:nucleotide-binding universal stress UspA family protein
MFAACGPLAGKGFEVHCEEPVDRAAEAIVASARRNRADLIAMTTHGRSGLGRALLGSVADEVVRTAQCPVLLVLLTEQN